MLYSVWTKSRNYILIITTAATCAVFVLMTASVKIHKAVTERLIRSAAISQYSELYNSQDRKYACTVACKDSSFVL